MIKSIQNEAFIYNPRHIQNVVSTNWLINIQFEGIRKIGKHIQNWLINSEATTIRAIYQNCHGYEIGNPKIL